jgi:hypothetical protein
VDVSMSFVDQKQRNKIRQLHFDDIKKLRNLGPNESHFVIGRYPISDENFEFEVRKKVGPQIETRKECKASIIAVLFKRNLYFVFDDVEDGKYLYSGKKVFANQCEILGFVHATRISLSDMLSVEFPAPTRSIEWPRPRIPRRTTKQRKI